MKNFYKLKIKKYIPRLFFKLLKSFFIILNLFSDLKIHKYFKFKFLNRTYNKIKKRINRRNISFFYNIITRTNILNIRSVFSVWLYSSQSQIDKLDFNVKMFNWGCFPDKEKLRKESFMIIDHSLGGGANLYSKKIIEEKRVNSDVLHIAYVPLLNLYRLNFFGVNSSDEYYLKYFSGITILYENLKVSEVFVNNLFSYPKIFKTLDKIIQLKTRFNFTLTVAVNDYLQVCPNYVLLNHKNRYCNVPPVGKCVACMQRNNGDFKIFYPQYRDVFLWRKKFAKLLRITDNILCFSNVSKIIIEKAFRDFNIGNNKITIKHHTLDDIGNIHFPIKHDPPYRVGVLGSINTQKGLNVIRKLLEFWDEYDINLFKIVIIGISGENISNPHLEITGKYDRLQLTEIVKKNKIDLFFIPSITPETFSYTAEEIMHMGYPLAVFSGTAPAERVVKYEKGIILL